LLAAILSRAGAPAKLPLPITFAKTRTYAPEVSGFPSLFRRTTDAEACVRWRACLLALR
jgi:hypothetical protein